MNQRNMDFLDEALTDIDDCYLQQAEKAPRKAKLLPWRKLGGIALAACLAICAVVGVGILMKNVTPPVSADPGIPVECAEQGHDYSIVKEVTTGRIILQCSVCESTKNLYDEIDESEYDSDESHFIYMDQIEAFGVLPDFALPNSESPNEQEHYESHKIYVAGEEGDICVIGYTGTSSKVKIPSQIDGKNVISVCLAYNDNDENITSIIFSEGIAAIYGSTGYNWKNLESVYFSDGLRIMGGVTPVAIQKAVQPDVEVEIGGGVEIDFIGVHPTPFRNCTKLTEVYLPDGFIHFALQPIFTRCTGITRYYLPKSYTPLMPNYPSLFVNENTEICGSDGKQWHGRFSTDDLPLINEDGYIAAVPVGDGTEVYKEHVDGKSVVLTSPEDIQRAKDFLYYRDYVNHFVDR